MFPSAWPRPPSFSKGSFPGDSTRRLVAPSPRHSARALGPRSRCQLGRLASPSLSVEGLFFQRRLRAGRNVSAPSDDFLSANFVDFR